MPRRIFTLNGMCGGRASRTRATISRAISGRLNKISAPAAAQHFFHRAGEIQVDGIEAGLDELQGGRGELLRRVAHQLGAARMLLVGHADEAPGLAALGHAQDKAVQQHFAQRVGRAQAPGDDPHRPIAIAAQAPPGPRESRFPADQCGADEGATSEYLTQGRKQFGSDWSNNKTILASFFVLEVPLARFLCDLVPLREPISVMVPKRQLVSAFFRGFVPLPSGACPRRRELDSAQASASAVSRLSHVSMPGAGARRPRGRGPAGIVDFAAGDGPGPRKRPRDGEAVPTVDPPRPVVTVAHQHQRQAQLRGQVNRPGGQLAARAARAVGRDRQVHAAGSVASSCRSAATPPRFVEPRTNSNPRWSASVGKNLRVAVPAQQHRQLQCPRR